MPLGIEPRRERAGHILQSYKLTTREQKQWLLQAAAEGGLLVDAEDPGHCHDNDSMVLDGATNLEHTCWWRRITTICCSCSSMPRCRTRPTLPVTFGELFGDNYIYQHQQEPGMTGHGD